MKTKKVLTLAVIMFLLTVSQKSFAQNYEFAFKENQVYFYIKFVPKQGNNYAHYDLRLVNKSGVMK